MADIARLRAMLDSGESWDYDDKQSLLAEIENQPHICKGETIKCDECREVVSSVMQRLRVCEDVVMGLPDHVRSFVDERYRWKPISPEDSAVNQILQELCKSFDLEFTP